ncbi:hypothetical protein LJC44_03410 [Parabacteroides sp. OttesenSCG-928-G06]|nr:hypothetical protein [Parabacteroides sp. OttesenSCG-928-G06]
MRFDGRHSDIGRWEDGGKHRRCYTMHNRMRSVAELTADNDKIKQAPHGAELNMKERLIQIVSHLAALDIMLATVP